MAQTKEERLRAVHDRALERFDRCYSSQREMRLQCVQDRRFAFVQGAQFEGDLEDQFANRPRFEINKLHQAIVRIFSEYRNNRVSVDFRPDDSDTSDDNAEFLDGLYRADEQESGAQEAYDTAFEEGVAGGMGAWRLVHKYDDEEDEDDDRRRICFEPIPDADNSVFFDIGAKKYDKSDASYCFVVSSMAAPEYEGMSGEDAEAAISEWQTKRKTLDPQGKGIASFDRQQRMGIYDWFAPDVVYVAEYYEVEEIKEPVHFYVHPMSGEEVKLRGKEQIAKDEPDLLAQGFKLERTKKVKARRVHKYLIDGNRVLEDCGYIAGNVIPVVPFYAKRLYVDNVERIMGHIRTAIDAQRLYNMLVSMLAEISVQSPMEKPILTPQQIVGHEAMWAKDSTERWPYLLINPLIDPATGAVQAAGPIAYTKPPQIPPALAGLMQLLGADMAELLGASGDQQELVSNISAKAVELIQNRLDMQNFIYMDNFKKSMRRCGEIWLAMARELYDEEERPMRVVNEDGTDKIVELRQPTTAEDDSITYTNDPAAGRFKVVADVGPSFTTRRDGTVRAVTGMLQFVEDPGDRAVLTSVAVKNLEGEGMGPVKTYFRRKMLALGLEKPTPQEQQEMMDAQANQQPDPQKLYLEAEAENARAKAAKALAETEKIYAQIGEIAEKLEGAGLDRIMKLIEASRGEVAMPPDPMAQPMPPGEMMPA